MGKIPIRYFKSPSCQTAFTRYMCYMNFPRCDATGASLLMCQSVCENFFTACNFPKSMWRCGPLKYNGLSAPETSASIDQNGIPIYKTSFWPGLPFGDNAVAGCTPGIPGGAASAGLSAAALGAAVAVGVGLLLAAPRE